MGWKEPLVQVTHICKEAPFDTAKWKWFIGLRFGSTVESLHSNTKASIQHQHQEVKTPNHKTQNTPARKHSQWIKGLFLPPWKHAKWSKSTMRGNPNSAYKRDLKAWRDRLVNKALASKARGPGFNPQDHVTMQSVVAHACSPNNGEAETVGSLDSWAC